MALSIEEVKKALKQCKLAGPCGDCPLKEDDECVRIMKAEAIKAIEDLEKRDAPVEPVREVGLYTQYFRCKKCDTLLVVKKQKYCFECGQAVKWE